MITLSPCFLIYIHWTRLYWTLCYKIEKLVKHFYQQKWKLTCFLGTAPPKDTSKCWISNVDFNNDNEKVINFCRFNGQFMGYAHSECNLNWRTLNYTQWSPTIWWTMTNIILLSLYTQPRQKSVSLNKNWSYNNQWWSLEHSILAFSSKHEIATKMNLQWRSPSLYWQFQNHAFLA